MDLAAAGPGIAYWKTCATAASGLTARRIRKTTKFFRIFLVLGKFNFLSALPQGQIWRWLIVGHTAARWTILPLSAWLPYARAEGQGRLVAKQVGALEILTATVTLFLVLLLLPWQTAIAALLVTTLVTLLSGLYFRTRLRGITGHCLDAANHLTAVILLRFDLLR